MTNLTFVLYPSRLLQIVMLSLFASSPVVAQVVPDATLPLKSNVNSQGNAIVITGGSRAGSNLFHSFQQFSVPTGSTVYFNNALDLRNIIGRVTGASVSNIDGLIKANGTANLFLINPNGILFGRNASLNIGGSFVGSTASSLKFADGTEFSAIAPQNKPLLTISVPIGLQFGPTPGDIRVEGPGAVRDPDTTLLLNRRAGLRVQPNQSLVLVGGNLSLQGSILTTDGGRIELGGVAGPGLVSLTPISKGWALRYEGIQDFRDIQLSQEAAVDASGRGGGDIQIQGDHVIISDSSQIEASTVGSQAGGTLAVTGSHAIEISGPGPSGFSSGIFSDVYPTATGAGDNLIVKAGQLIIKDGGSIESFTRSRGQGGDLVANVPGRTELSGTSPSGNPSSLVTATIGAGNAGKIAIFTGDLILTDGAQVLTNTRSQGQAGDLSIRALNSVKLIGSPKERLTGLLAEAEPTSTGGAANIKISTENLIVTDGAVVGSSSAGLGPAGNITITTRDLLAIDGGQLQAATSGPGQAGNLTVDALGSVNLRGTTSSGFPSGLFTLTEGSGNAGNLTLSATNLKASDGAVLSASSRGRGNAGNIYVRAANAVAFSGFGPTGLSGGILATTSGLGQGGNITVDASALRVADGAVVSARTIAEGNGGNITVKANTFDAAAGGQILTTTSSSGRAGNISLNVPKSVTLSGSDPNYATRLSLLGTNGISTQGAASAVFANTSPGSTGKGGTISIDPNKLTLIDGASIAVNSFGRGDAGNLNVRAGTVTLDRAASLSAATASGQGGNIFLNAQNLQLRHNSPITATAGGSGNGGNITINTGTLAALEGSPITANAYQGRGGNIQINAQGIFRSPDSAITASSRLGINGAVQINTPYIDLARAAGIPVTPPQTPQVGSVCSGRSGSGASSLVYTGTGGTPPSSSDPLSSSTGWHDNSLPPQVADNLRATEQVASQPGPFTPVTGWIIHPDGTMNFTYDAAGSVPYSSTACHQANAADK